MTTVQLDPIDDFEKVVGADKKRLARAITAGMREAGNQIKQGGRASIAAGGLSSRWQNALRVDLYPKSGVSTKPALLVFHKIRYAGQFEDPQPVSGRPLIWLPIDANLPGGGKGQRWTPHKFTLQVGPLRAGRHGSRPMLFAQISVSGGGKVLPLTRKGARARPAKKSWLPVFVGVSSVHDPKLFDIRGVVERVGTQLEGIIASKLDNP